MAVTAHFYNSFFTALAQGKINLTSDTLKLALVGSGYTPNQAADQFWSTPQAYEISGTGYTAGGVVIGSIAITTAGWDFTGANAQWSSATFSAYKAVLYDAQSGSAATDPLIGWVDFGGVQSPSNGVFAVNWAAAGIGVITPA
ncbi:gp27 protein [Mycobacterium xenopi RIVM700367]|uniref:hypothetical protein n=1 Tax=Mycobacterium xenopi TaxID=1789 RepID=UPI00025AE386|nr:hypothetical protein [Mycobacterium xenopi]EID12923.1 gp27 protein [Mycobacterium xenopi RIVM700367]